MSIRFQKFLQTEFYRAKPWGESLSLWVCAPSFLACYPYGCWATSHIAGVGNSPVIKSGSDLICMQRTVGTKLSRPAHN